MADQFTGNHVQGVFGKFKGVLDETIDLSDDQVQGVLGEFQGILDAAAEVFFAPDSNAVLFLMRGSETMFAALGSEDERILVGSESLTYTLVGRDDQVISLVGGPGTEA